MSYLNKPNEIRHPQAALLIEEYVAQRVQSLGYTGDLNSEEVNQLTDSNVVEVVDADPSVSLTIDINEFGSINYLNQLAGYYANPVHSQNYNTNSNPNSGLIDHTTFSDVATDFLVVVKDSQTATAPSRALWFSNCFVESISGTYQVDGFASESVSMSGAHQQWFLNDWKGVRIGRATHVAGGSGYLDVTHALLDGSVIYLTEDGIRLNETYWGQSVTTGDITEEGGYVFSPNSRYRYVVRQNTPTFPSLSDVAAPVGGVKEGEIEIILWDNTEYTEPGVGISGDTKYKALRVQSVDYEIAFEREDLKQMYTGTYYKGLNNTTVTASITLNDSDLEMWALTTSKYRDWANASSDVSTISLADFQSMGNLSMRIDVFNTKDYLLHDTGTLLKSIKFVDGKVTSVADSRDVPGRGSQTFDLQFSSAQYYGTGLIGR